MLTIDVLKSSAKLASLSDEQLKEIALLSENDEDKAISAKTKEIHDKYDKDIESITGKKKEGDVKSYDNLKAVLTGYVEKIVSLKSDLSKSKAANIDLEKKVKEGSNDEVLKTKIGELEQTVKDKEGELLKVRNTFEEEKKELESKVSFHQDETMSLRIDSEFNAYAVKNNLKFNDSIPETILNETIEARKAQLKAELKPEYIKDGAGNMVLIFRDENGEIMRNKENGLNPFTAGELYMDKIQDLLSSGQKQAGAGTGQASKKVSANLDLTGVKSQLKADEIISNHILVNEGIAKRDAKFSERQQEIREEYKVSDLPIRDGE